MGRNIWEEHMGTATYYSLYLFAFLRLRFFLSLAPTGRPMSNADSADSGDTHNRREVKGDPMP